MTDDYAYETNAATSGNTALLDLVTLGIGGTRDSDYDAGGYLDLVNLGANVLDFTFDDAAATTRSTPSTGSCSASFSPT